MTKPEKGHQATRIPAGEQAAEEDRSTQPETAPDIPAGKASTAPAEQIVECSADTIEDSDGNYLEPPD